MQPRTIRFSTQCRTASAALPVALIRATRTQVAALDHIPDADIPAAVEDLCGAVADCVRALDVAEEEAEALQGIRAALKGEEVDSSHPAVALAIDVKARTKALRAIVPDLDIDSDALADLDEEIGAAIEKATKHIKSANGRLASLERALQWNLYGAILRAPDIGRCIRALIRANIVPTAIDPGLSYGPLPDASAPDGSPSRNTHAAISILTAADSLGRQDRARAGEAAGRSIAAEIRSLLATEGEAA